MEIPVVLKRLLPPQASFDALVNDLIATATSSLSRLGLNKDFTADDVAHEANEGDDFALMMIERTGKYIGTGVASVINLLNIERIVLGRRRDGRGTVDPQPNHSGSKTPRIPTVL